MALMWCRQLLHNASLERKQPMPVLTVLYAAGCGSIPVGDQFIVHRLYSGYLCQRHYFFQRYVLPTGYNTELTPGVEP